MLTLQRHRCTCSTAILACAHPCFAVRLIIHKFRWLVLCSIHCVALIDGNLHLVDCLQGFVQKYQRDHNWCVALQKLRQTAATCSLKCLPPCRQAPEQEGDGSGSS